jgi:hypothetical protein
MLQPFINALVPFLPGMVELPESYGARIFALAKGAGHRYIKRIPKAGGGYRYFYKVGHGGTVANADHFVEGAAFQHEGGHFHITKTDGDKVTIRHDETGESKTVTKSALREMLSAHHGEAIKAHSAKVKARESAGMARMAREHVHRPHGHGSDTVVFFADKSGQPRDHAARWRVVEADSIHASHLPTSGFKENPNYPKGVQERVYHSDKAEQNKVLGNADRFRGEIVHNTNPDAVNGAPVMTEDGVVLGGNSRTMTMQHLYNTERGSKVKDHLLKEAHQFGLDKKEIAAMRNPILVRELKGIRADETSKGELKTLVRQANESFTQGMDPRADQVARALKLSDDAVVSLASSLGADETVSDFLSKNTAPTKAFVEELRQSGAIDRRNESQYLRRDGSLNEDGRNYVARLFVGKLVPDPQLLGDIPTSTMNALARSAPYILGAKGAGREYDITGDLRSALHAMVEMDIHGSKDIGEHLRQHTINVDGKSIVGDLDVAKKPRARMVLDVIQGRGPAQLSRVFREFNRRAHESPEGQGSLFGGGPDAMDTLRRAVKTAVEKGAQVYYGPKGGKYADPEHTISWTADAKGGEQSDWVGHEGDSERAKRNIRVSEALTAWREAATGHGQKKGDRAAYQEHYAALHGLGKALGLGTGEDAVDGAKRWLRAKGYKVGLHNGSGKAKAKQEAFAFA